VAAGPNCRRATTSCGPGEPDAVVVLGSMHRVAIARALGCTHVPCLALDLDEAQDRLCSSMRACGIHQDIGAWGQPRSGQRRVPGSSGRANTKCNTRLTLSIGTFDEA